MKKMVSIIGIGLAIMLLLLSGCSDTMVITDFLKNENFDEAVAQYNKMEKPDASIEKAFIAKLDSIYEDFKNNSADYTATTAKIESISHIDNLIVQNECGNTEKKVNALNDSRTAFETGESFEKDNNYNEAIKQYSLVIEEDSNYDAALEKIASCSKKLSEETIASAEEFVRNADYESALKTLNEAQNLLPNDTDITKAITVYSESYVDDIIGQADELAQGKNLDEAEKLIKNALKIAPNNQKLNDKLSETKNLRPVGLDTVHLIDSKNYKYKPNGFTDSFGNTYSGVHYYHNLWSSIGARATAPYSIFNLNNEYKTFKGAIVASESTHSKCYFYVIISADGKELFSKHGIQKTTGKIDFEVDVTDCQQLKIEVGEDNTYTVSSKDNLGIVDAILEKV